MVWNVVLFCLFTVSFFSSQYYHLCLCSHGEELSYHLRTFFPPVNRGVQLTNPFYSIWASEVGTELAVSFANNIQLLPQSTKQFLIKCWTFRKKWPFKSKSQNCLSIYQPIDMLQFYSCWHSFNNFFYFLTAWFFFWRQHDLETDMRNNSVVPYMRALLRVSRWHINTYLFDFCLVCWFEWYINDSIFFFCPTSAHVSFSPPFYESR